MRVLPCAALLLLFAGCEQSHVQPPSAPAPEVRDRDLFGPSKMSLHPTFTQVKSLAGGGKPDGIEAVLEFDDRFGDSTKAAGAIVFELYTLRKGFPDPRGPRIVEPWIASLDSPDQQQAHWRRELGAYSFLLSFGGVRADRDYVLTATFEPLTGPRLFSQTILTRQPAPPRPSSAPAAQ